MGGLQVIYLYGVLFSLAGGLIYRLRGGLWNNRVPTTYWRAAFSLPFMFSSMYDLHRHHDVDQIGLLMFTGLITFLLTFGAVSTGHGNFQDMGTWSGKDHPTNWLEKIIYPLKSTLMPYWYDFLGMMLSGLVIAAPAAILFTHIWLLPAGMLKAVAYAIGWRIYPNGGKITSNGFDHATEIGEFLTGVFLWGALWLAV